MPKKKDQRGKKRKSGTKIKVRPRDRWLWAWPVLLVAIMALAGQFFGPFGVLVGGLVAISALVAHIGEGVIGPKTLLAVVAVACTAAMAIIYARTSGQFVPKAEQPAAAQGKVLTASGKEFSLAELKDGHARGATLIGAVVDNLDLTEAELNGIVAPGVSFKTAILNHAHLAGTDLRGTDLHDTQLRNADLRGANLSGANLSRADLSGSCLRGADLSGAILTHADFHGAAVADVKVGQAARAASDGWPAVDTVEC